jgi:hypothetical protein
MRLVDDIEAQRAGRDTKPRKDRDAMRDLGLSIMDFLEDPPKRCRSATQLVLTQALVLLKQDRDAIDEAGK